MKIIAPKLTSYQKAILDSQKRFTITEAATKCGKTFSHIWWLFREAHLPQKKEGCNYWWVAPVYSQSEIAFTRIVSKIRGAKGYTIIRSPLMIKCPNGSILMFKSADNPDSLYGEDVYGAVFDEFTRAKVEAWIALRSTLTATNAKCKLIGNHLGIGNWGHGMKEKAKDQKSEYEYFKITAYDAAKEGIISFEEIEQARKDLPAAAFSQLYLAESVTEKNQLIENSKILDLFTNNYVVGSAQKFITCDLAITNDDFVLFVWDGLKVIDYNVTKGLNYEFIVKTIMDYKTKYSIPNSNIAYDGDGMGMVFNKGLEGMQAVRSGQTLGKQYANARVHFEVQLAELINNGKIFIECKMLEIDKQNLIEELQLFKLTDNSIDGKMMTLKNIEKKNIISRSCDISSAFKYRMIFYICWGK